MNKGFEKIVAWQYNGWTAIGVLFESDDFISVALNYKMDIQIKKGDIWYSDSICTDEGTSVRPASDEEIKMLCKALDDHHVPYEYDEETKTILNYQAYYYSNYNALSLKEYQRKAMTTCMPSSNNFSYMFLNLVGEVGEFASKVGKAIRKEQACIEYNDLDGLRENEELQKEAGDILWQLSGVCTVMGWNLEHIAQQNLDKLAARKKVRTIDGSGDGIIRNK